jgi:hypothetical protein
MLQSALSAKLKDWIGDMDGSVCAVSDGDIVNLPANDATSEALAHLRRANLVYRKVPWPAPYDKTKHVLHLGDARDMSWIPDESVHLVVTLLDTQEVRRPSTADGRYC